MKNAPLACGILLAKLVLGLNISAGAADALLEGFELPEALKLAGRAVPAKGADAVTEGTSALELSPGASVEIPAGAAGQVGWLKLDTFEPQAVAASLELRLTTLLPGAAQPATLAVVSGHVAPGKDVLALPLGLVARSERVKWPKQAVTLSIRNAGPQPVVVDNLRLSPPEAPPGGAAVLDFGPPDQALWPGFEPAEAQGAGVAFSGKNRTYSNTVGFPDPLLDDFVGLNLAQAGPETVTIQGPKDGGTAWVYLTHYGPAFFQSLEYSAKFNGRGLFQKRLSPAEIVADCLLEGRDLEWTPENFQKTFLPKLISRLELPLNAGPNALELLNCQLAAVIVAPKASQNAAKAYVGRLESDLERYRKQFVLNRLDRPRCDVAPTPEETKAGLIVFAPPPDDAFNRFYLPQVEHRARSLKLSALTGQTVSAALVVVPLADGFSQRGLSAGLEALTDSGKTTTLPPQGCRALLLETVTVARDGLAAGVPFLPARSLAGGKTWAKGVYWLDVRLKAPDKAAPGLYTGNLKLTAPGAPGSSAVLPVELEVARLAGAAIPARRDTFGVLTEADPGEAYQSAAPKDARQQQQKTREIFSLLFDAGLNAGMLKGPAPDPAPLLGALQSYPLTPKEPGKAMINISGALNSLRSAQIQPGTDKYVETLRDLVKKAEAARSGLKDYALYLGYYHPASELAEAAKAAAIIKAAGGKAAVATYVSNLSELGEAARKELFAALDTLLAEPNGKDLGALGEAFRAGGGKTLLVLSWHPDVYACGLYAWGVGADGFYLRNVFAHNPPFNPFWFDGLSLLTVSGATGFEGTLSMLQVQQAMEDYALARRCEALVKAGKSKGADTTALDKVLLAIRLHADANGRWFDSQRFRPGGIALSQLQEWRQTLIQEAGWLAQKLGG